MVDTGGASRGGFDARKGQHEFSWRDAMDIPVRWRQLSEPNDQVSLWAELSCRKGTCRGGEKGEMLCREGGQDCCCMWFEVLPSVVAAAAELAVANTTVYVGLHQDREPEPESQNHSWWLCAGQA